MFELIGAIIFCTILFFFGLFFFIESIKRKKEADKL